MNDWATSWARAGVRFDLSHSDLDESWVSCVEACTFGAGLLLPPERSPEAVDDRLKSWERIFAGEIHAPPSPSGLLKLAAGDVVFVSDAGVKPGSTSADQTRMVRLSVRRKGRLTRVETAPNPARFWLRGNCQSPADVIRRLQGAALDYAKATRAVAYDLRGHPGELVGALTLMAEAWAFAGYSAARQEYADALADGGIRQTAAARAERSKPAERDRQIARQFLLDEQGRGGTSHLSREAVARHVLDVLAQSGDRTASERSTSTVIQAVTPLFERSAAAKRWIPRKLIADS